MNGSTEETVASEGKKLSHEIVDAQKKVLRLIDELVAKDVEEGDRANRTLEGSFWNQALDSARWIKMAMGMGVFGLEQLKIKHPELFKELISSETHWPVFVSSSDKGWVKKQMPEYIFETLYQSGLGTGRSSIPPGKEDCLGAEIKFALSQIRFLKDDGLTKHLWNNQRELFREFHEAGPGFDYPYDLWEKIFALPILTKKETVLGRYSDVIFDQIFRHYMPCELHEEEANAKRTKAEAEGRVFRYDLECIDPSERISMELFFRQGGKIEEPPEKKSEYYEQSCYVYTIMKEFGLSSALRKKINKGSKLIKKRNKEVEAAKVEIEGSYMAGIRGDWVDPQWRAGSEQDSVRNVDAETYIMEDPDLNPEDLRKIEKVQKLKEEEIRSRYEDEIAEVDVLLSDENFRRHARKIIRTRLKTMVEWAAKSDTKS